MSATAGAEAARELARQLRLARAAQGVSLRTVGEAVGLDHTAITRIENCVRELRLSEAIDIANFLQVDIRQVFTNDGAQMRPGRDQLVEQHLRDALSLIAPNEGEQS